MSWQPVVGDAAGYGLPWRRGCRRRGTAPASPTTAAAAGFRSGTLMIEMPSCGGWQSGKVAARGVGGDVQVDVLPCLSGTSVWVCEPQAVSTAATYCGLRLSLMSKILMPSQDVFSVAGWEIAGARVVAARGVGGQEQQVPGDRDVVLASPGRAPG